MKKNFLCVCLCAFLSAAFAADFESVKRECSRFVFDNNATCIESVNPTGGEYYLFKANLAAVSVDNEQIRILGKNEYMGELEVKLDDLHYVRYEAPVLFIISGQ